MQHIASVLRENERVGYEAAKQYFHCFGPPFIDPTRARYLPVPSTAHQALAAEQFRMATFAGVQNQRTPT
jgi:hypothetical protein